MASTQEVNGSVKEHLERALRDNPERSQREAADRPVRFGPEPEAYGQTVETRIRAIKLVRDLEPRRVCLAERVLELKRSLAETPANSSHFEFVVDKLKETRNELLRLEQALLAASYDIRTTRWIVDLLSEPPADLSRGAAASAHD